mmetsp:Transcript_12583/g.41415  ORF Transcript_12583/g.41415 Transcript_12583/m.41415 type:complete len:227 (-) Transcript_12583:187-867(-)
MPVRPAQLAVGRSKARGEEVAEPQQSHGAGGGLGVAHARLDAAQRLGERCLGERCSSREGRRLDGVPERRAGAVRLVAREGGGLDASVGEGGPQQRLLRLPVGRGEARALAVLPHAAAEEGEPRRVAIAAWLQHCSVAALAAAVAVGAAVKRVRAASGGGHAGDSQADARRLAENHVDAEGEGSGALVHLQRTQAAVRRDEAARASRVDRRAGPLQAKHKREASRR